MAFQQPQVPFKLTAEDTGVGDFGKSLGQGASAIDTIIGSYLKNRQAQEIEEKLPYVGQQAAADVRNKQLINQYYAPNIQSEMAQRSALANYYGEESKTNKYKREHGLLQPEALQMAQYYDQTGNPNMPQSYHQPQPEQQQQPEMQIPTAQNPVLQRPQIQNLADQISEQLKQQPGFSPQMQQTPNIPQVPSLQEQAANNFNQQGLIPGTDFKATRTAEGNAYKLKQLGYSPTQEVDTEYKRALITQARDNAIAKDYDKMPTNQKDFALAQAAGMGIDNGTATARLRAGEHLPDLAESKGYDRNNPDSWPEPIYTATTAIKTQQGKANIARAAYNSIQPTITADLAPYSQKLPNGYSLAQVADAVSGQNKEKQGKAMAAAYMATEMQALIARSGGIQNIGIGLMRDMLSKSALTLKTADILRDPEVFKYMQKNIERYGNIINNAENKEMNRRRQRQNEDDDKADSEISKQMNNQSGDVDLSGYL